jgi:phosphate transport system substrate-binding protein
MKRALVTVAMLVLAVSICGCAQNKTGKTTQAKTVFIVGDGATFPMPQINAWISCYMKEHPNVKIEYNGGGSGHGQTDFLKGLVDFAGSDPPLKKALWEKLVNHPPAKGKDPLQFPDIIGAVVICYNIPGVSHLRLDGQTLADIFMGKIKYWDNPEIKALNPGVSLPHKEIIVIHRSDASGTTDIFTSYLCLVSSVWNSTIGAGKSVNWPNTGRMIGGEGNPGVVAELKSTPYSICYTELSYALKEKLNMVALKNKAGNFVVANSTTIRSAASHVSKYIAPPDAGYKENLRQLLNAPGNSSYPIVAFSNLLVWKHYSNPAEGKAVHDFIKWILTKGQNDKYIVSGYVGLPKTITQKVLSEAGI